MQSYLYIMDFQWVQTEFELQCLRAPDYLLHPQEPGTLSALRLCHPAGRSINSDWFVKSFVTVVHEKQF